MALAGATFVAGLATWTSWAQTACSKSFSPPPLRKTAEPVMVPGLPEDIQDWAMQLQSRSYDRISRDRTVVRMQDGNVFFLAYDGNDNTRKGPNLGTLQSTGEAHFFQKVVLSEGFHVVQPSCSRAIHASGDIENGDDRWKNAVLYRVPRGGHCSRHGVARGTTSRAQYSMCVVGRNYCHDHGLVSKCFRRQYESRALTFGGSDSARARRASLGPGGLVVQLSVGSLGWRESWSFSILN
jgi:hypothetical protein